MTPRTRVLSSLLVLLVVSGLAWWSPLVDAEPASVDAEIAYLIGVIDTSSCDFERNGSWYDGREAAAHLRDKYRWLARVRRIETAEEFIEQVASSSSFSGRPYILRCAGAAEINTAPWLREALASYRKPAKTDEAAHPSPRGAPAS